MEYKKSDCLYEGEMGKEKSGVLDTAVLLPEYTTDVTTKLEKLKLKEMAKLEKEAAKVEKLKLKEAIKLEKEAAKVEKLKLKDMVKLEKEAAKLEKLKLKEAIKLENLTKKVVTEDLGQMFEMAICKTFDIPFDGNFNYSMETALQISEHIQQFKSMYPYKLTHTARGGCQYDFTGTSIDTTNETINVKLSAKTNKKGGKVSPQVLGQATVSTFCKHFNLTVTTTPPEIKQYILDNISSMLPKYYSYTFDADILYYNESKGKILFIQRKDDICWEDYPVSFTRNTIDSDSASYWNESSSISIDGKNIGEFQVHNHRNCIKFRWNFENLLVIFKEKFDITTVYDKNVTI